jgi:hypothetical protein
LNAAQQIGDVLLTRKNRTQSFELRLEIPNLTTEFGQTFRCRQASLNFGLHGRELRLTLRDALLRGLRVEIPEDTGAGSRQESKRANLAVPRQLAESEVHGHLCVSGSLGGRL